MVLSYQRVFVILQLKWNGSAGRTCTRDEAREAGLLIYAVAVLYGFEGRIVPEIIEFTIEPHPGGIPEANVS